MPTIKSLSKAPATSSPDKAGSRSMKPNWSAHVSGLISAITRRDKSLGEHAKANRDSVRRALDGQDPFGSRVDAAAGARIVVNISSAHVPAFCAASAKGDLRPYKNGHEIATLGGRRVSKNRKRVDNALPRGVVGSTTYFGAVALNGCGIRFYGDLCLVLRPNSATSECVILDRNSFEVLRAPAADTIRRMKGELAQNQSRKDILLSWSGVWGTDLAQMACARLLPLLSMRPRRWTIGQISAAICDDEDYLEALMPKSFGTAELQEVRLSVDDASHDAWLGSRVGRGGGPTPSLTSLIWRQRRRTAERALHAAGVPVRVMTTQGRTRG